MASRCEQRSAGPHLPVGKAAPVETLCISGERASRGLQKDQYQRDQNQNSNKYINFKITEKVITVTKRFIKAVF